MKILLCLETSGGGSGRHVLDLAQALAQRDHDVTVIYSPVRAETEFIWALHGACGITAIPCAMHRSVGIHDLASAQELARLVRAHGAFDILHAHSSKAGALVRLLPRSIPGARIYTPHAFRTMDPNISAVSRLVYANAERLLAMRTDALIAVSDDEARHARRLGISPTKITTIINGVDPVQTQPRNAIRERLGLSQSARVAGFVGRFSNQKDPLRFAIAINLARRHTPDLVGLMIGDGELRPDIEAVADPGALYFTGWTNARQLMPAMDVLVMTSRYEAMPYTLLEALSAGLPMICTDVGGTQETLSDRGNGRRLEVSASAEEIAAVLSDSLGDPSRLAQWGGASRVRASRYTINEMADGVEAAYHRAMGAAPPPARAPK